MKTGRLLKPLRSKLPGVETYRQHRIGTPCRYERHSGDTGVFVLFFADRYYAKVNAIDLPDTIDMKEKSNGS
jgi:hypothetical protein